MIVDPRQRMLAAAYTGPPAGLKLPLDVECDRFCLRAVAGPTPETAVSYEDCLSVHAEVNSLLLSDRSEREGGSIYVTSCPCWSCAKAIANSGLRTVWLVGVDLKAVAHRNPQESLDLLRRSGLTVETVE